MSEESLYALDDIAKAIRGESIDKPSARVLLQGKRKGFFYKIVAVDYSSRFMGGSSVNKTYMLLWKLDRYDANVEYDYLDSESDQDAIEDAWKTIDASLEAAA